MKNKKALFTTKWIAYTAMMTALVVATTAIPPAPTPAGNVYWCDGAIFLAAYLLDPIAAFIVGGMGTFLYDLVFGNATMMCVSLVIHGLQGAAVSLLLHYVLPKNREAIWAGVASVVGGLIVIAGYFLTYWLILEALNPGKYGLEYAAVRIVRNVIQEVIGIAIAMVICYATTFKTQLQKNNLLPDFRGEVLSARTHEKEKEAQCGSDA